MDVPAEHEGAKGTEDQAAQEAAGAAGVQPSVKQAGLVGTQHSAHQYTEWITSPIV